MSTFSHVVEPHRVLKPRPDDPQRGEDVRALQVAALRRLDARGIDRDLKVDGILGVKTLEVLDTAAHFLGALESTTRQAAFPIGAQEMIRYPGRRNPDQLQRAEDRMEKLRADREAARKRHLADKPDDDGGVSGLSASQRSEARERAVDAMELLYKHAPAVHYTQGPRRWDGIRQHLRSADGKFPLYADCSSSTTWALWNALTGVGGLDFRDIVNGSGWSAGFTGTQTAHGVWVPLNKLLPGDLLFYGSPIGHVAMYRGLGRVYSHGSDAGPFDLPMSYRPIITARRYI